MNADTAINPNNDPFKDMSTSKEYLTIFIADQMFGIPVLEVEDVLGWHDVTTIPLAPAEVAGSLNLRGRVVTAINVRKKLDMDTSQDEKEQMSVVVEHEGELYSLIIDRVGDVLNLQDEDYEDTPATLDPLWREISMGIYRLKNELLLILDIQKLIESVHN